MTSYANVNDANSTAAGAAVTPATTRTLTTTTTATTTLGNTPQTPSADNPAGTSPKEQQQQQQQQLPLNYDEYAPTDGPIGGPKYAHFEVVEKYVDEEREKEDSTPENLKKIAEIIGQQQQQRQRHHNHQHQQHQQQQPEQQQQQMLPTANSSSPSPSPSSSSAAAAAATLAFTAADRLSLSAAAAGGDGGAPPPPPSSSPPPPLLVATVADDSTAAAPANQFCNKTALSKADSADDATNAGDDAGDAGRTAAAAKQQSYAFTIDDASDSAATAAKYKTMMERFQSRHRRGASLSKLEACTGGDAAPGTPNAMTTSAGPALPVKAAQQRHSHEGGGGDTAAETPTAPAAKVKLRARDRSTSRVRDAAKRHSWSPRSSNNELSMAPPQPAEPASHKVTSQRAAAGSYQQQQHYQQRPPTAVRKTQNSKSTATAASTAAGVAAANQLSNRTQFTPRSIAMQMALQKVDFMCSQPPLADYKPRSFVGSAVADCAGYEDELSETGTYTVDGDNYTEEEKNHMNIDTKQLRRAQHLKQQQQQQQQQQQERLQKRPKQLDLRALAPGSAGRGPTMAVAQRSGGGGHSNVLEVSCLYEETQTRAGRHAGVLALETPTPTPPPLPQPLLLDEEQQQQQLELEQELLLKSTSTEEGDMGCFTSVTTSGVLAKQSALDPRPKIARRRSGLSTSQVDSSEFISNGKRLQHATATDRQKSEYSLNVFTNQKDMRASSPPAAADAALLKTAQTKTDWIQEWARNARARSLANDTGARHRSSGGGGGDMQATQRGKRGDDLMTRSYTCATSGCDEHHAAAAAKLQQSLADRHRRAEFDYGSDPALASACCGADSPGGSYKPPKSPTKIPSPLHSMGRARSANRARTSLQNILSPSDDLEESAQDYLRKTAAAICSLQQSLSRKSSLQSPPANAARAHSAHPSAGVYSPDECSPRHSLESSAAAHQQQYQQQHQQQQQQQLMTSSFNEQQLQLLTSGQYLVRQMRARKNSFDGSANVSPLQRRLEKYATDLGQQQQSYAGDPQSPLRRSSSYSTKIATGATTRAARPQFQNLYTPPAMRHYAAYALNTGGGGGGGGGQPLIKKSSSSNNFDGPLYGDFEEHSQYYIKDEDEELLEDGEAYYSSGEDLELERGGYYAGDVEPLDALGGTTTAASAGVAVPLSNTRWNKALLMRIERSKQKVNGAPPPPSANQRKAVSARVTRIAANAGVAGAAACPNTPELPRRVIKSAREQRSGGGAGVARQSMPRDTSLSRLARQVPNSLASAKRQLLQTAATAAATTTTPRTQPVGGGGVVQPKYLDISKYKPAQGQNFLRKNDAKSTLKGSPSAAVDGLKRSPSRSSAVGLTRNDAARTSTRSMKSAAMPACMTASGSQLGGGGGGGGMHSSAAAGRAASAARRNAAVDKQKEAEMAMWKRRSSYDPMKAAAEDRRRKEEAKRLAAAKSYDILADDTVPCESTESGSLLEAEADERELQTAHWTLGAQVYGENEEF